LKRSAADEDDHNLQCDNKYDDTDEEKVAEDPLEHVEFVIETSVVENIEDLHPDEAVENDSIKLNLLVRI